MSQFRNGERAPQILGATQAGRFFSMDAQAGRPAILVSLGAGSAVGAKEAFDRAVPALEPLLKAGIDVVPLAPQAMCVAPEFKTDDLARQWVVFVAAGAELSHWVTQGSPLALFVDRGGRVVRSAPFETAQDLQEAYAALAPRLQSDPPSLRRSAAPVLMVPNIMPLEICRSLIAYFEASDHRPGVMAGVVDGVAGPKADEAKKKRRDLELTAEAPGHREVVEILAQRCAPEIKRAFQSDITFADRILLARYDDTGGYFKRHRDNVAPQTAFREFAISINLNTYEYEGGELLFPEYDDQRYSPPAGGALIFSASLLHEAAPVLVGRRYVLLSFLCSAAAQARVVQAA